MAGLLDFFGSPDAQLGLGLLAAAAPRAGGVSFGQGMQEALGYVDMQRKMKLAEAQQAQAAKYQAMQMQKAERDMANEQRMQSIIGSNFQPEVQAAADGYGPTRPMSFDSRNAASQLGQAGMGMEALNLMSKFRPKEADYKVVGNALVKIGPDGVTPAYTAPEKPEASPSSVREYQFAQGQGYKGSFVDFQNAQNSAKAPKMSVDLRDPTAVAKAAMGLQNDYRTATKPSYARAQAYESMVQASADPSPKGDLTMVYSFIKALDPESVVREGEIGLVNANRSIPDQIKGYAQKLATGKSLLPEERQDLIKQAQTLTNTDYKRSRNDVKAYRDNAQRLGLDPNLYAPDPYQGFKPSDSSTAAKKVIKTGTYGGRKVVQYDDGTTDYAN